MRPGQQNKRGRGRNNNNNNNNNRKGGNPLSRTYDSSGPDVKIRGTAQHIAEKYATLARDAQSSSDNVMAENYLQHAEHYNRIIAAAQAQMQERHQRDERENSEREGSNERDSRDDNERSAGERSDRGSSNGSGRGNTHGNGHDRSGEQEPVGGEAQPHVNGSGPQPEIEGVPAEVAMGEEAEGNGAGGGSARRRGAASRPRRPRRSDAAAAEETGSGEKAEGEKPARRSRATKSAKNADKPDSDPVAEVASE